MATIPASVVENILPFEQIQGFIGCVETLNIQLVLCVGTHR